MGRLSRPLGARLFEAQHYRKAVPVSAVSTGLTGLALVALAASAAAAISAAKTCTPMEVQIWGCQHTLLVSEYEMDLPEVFGCMLEEGRTTLKTQAVLRELLVVEEDDLFAAISILIMTRMAKGLRDLHFASMFPCQPMPMML